MSDHDILSDAEREALSAVMLEPDLPMQRVLIVDDDKDARELLSQILELDGIRCRTAASGETALKMLVNEEELKKLSIGLVITDLRMGNVDGLDLVRQVRESARAALPIIIVSGDADVKDAIEAMHLSVVDFLLKPIDTGKLLALVKHELGMDVQEPI
ncbi:response regulator [Pseudomonas sp.]|uniref:response regulator n=1 Tax=Pseudomonas sp. TaxID=306 RepID=UPI003F3C12AA